MTPYVRTLAAVANSLPCVHDTQRNPFALSLAVVISGTATAKVQYTLDDMSLATDATGAGLTWLDHDTLVALTATARGNVAFPVTATRLVVSALSSGTVVMTAIQAGL